MLIQVMLRRATYYNFSFYVFFVFFCLSSCLRDDPINHVPLEEIVIPRVAPTTKNKLAAKFKGKKRCFYLLHGLGDQINSYLENFGKLLKTKIQDCNCEYKYVTQNLDAIHIRVQNVIDYIKEQEAQKSHDYFFIIGYSLGGVVATDVAAALKDKENGLFQKLAGVVTINSPMGGIPNDAMIRKVAAGMLKNLKDGLADIYTNSPYFQRLKERVRPMKFPILSIASKIILSPVGQSGRMLIQQNVNNNNEFNSLLKVLPESDGMVPLDSQIDVKNWRSPDAGTIAVKAYAGYIHGHLDEDRDKKTLTFLKMFATSKDSILDNRDMRTMLANFINDPEATVAECGIKDVASSVQ